MMHEFIYIPVRESLFSRELGHYLSFGLVASENGVPHSKVSDISTDESFVTELAQQCSAGYLDPIHLYDVIEDSLGV